MADSEEVALSRTRGDGTGERLAVAGPGNDFGEPGPLLDLPRSADDRALTDAEVTGSGA